MSATFVGQLRSGRAPVALAEAGQGTISFRVQAAELWDAIRVTARADTPLAQVKQRVVKAFYPAHEYTDDFILKLRGWEMLDELAPIGESGIVPGSIVLLDYRRRRPVR